MRVSAREVAVTPKTVGEVARILESRSFKEWLRELEQRRKEVRLATERYTELLTQVNLLEFRAELVHRRAVDTLDRANQLEDESVQLANEAAQIENDSFEAVSQYETQRDTTTKVWQRLGALDVDVEEASEEAAKKRLLKQRDRLNLDYLREDTRKQKLWSTVERLWVRNISKGLELREKKRKAQIVRQEAEAAFAQHRLEADQALVLRERSQAAAAEMGEREQNLLVTEDLAPERFDCLLHHEFLYWPALEDNKWVYAVPVIHDDKHYGLPLSPGALYRCRHDRGVDGLEQVALEEAAPAPQEAAASESPEAEAVRAESPAESPLVDVDGDSAVPLPPASEGPPEAADSPKVRPESDEGIGTAESPAAADSADTPEPSDERPGDGQGREPGGT